MNNNKQFTFPKGERLCLKKDIDLLFGHPDLRLNRYPLLFLIRIRQGDEPVRTVISVPKKKVRRAVKRNLIKRRMREAFRMNKSALYNVLPDNVTLDLAIVYTGDGGTSFDKIQNALISLIDDTGKRITEIR